MINLRSPWLNHQTSALTWQKSKSSWLLTQTLSHGAPTCVSTILPTPQASPWLLVTITSSMALGSPWINTTLTMIWLTILLCLTPLPSVLHTMQSKRMVRVLKSVLLPDARFARQLTKSTTTSAASVTPPQVLVTQWTTAQLPTTRLKDCATNVQLAALDAQTQPPALPALWVSFSETQ